VATHPHSDHIGGLIQVLKSLPVGEIWDIAMPSGSPVYRDFLLAVRGAKTPDGKRPVFRKVRAGLSLEPAPNIRLSVLAPREPLLTSTRSDPNNNSIVLRLDAPGGSFLFTGDIEREGRRRLAGANLRADVLKVSHHGAVNGTDRAFLERVNPRVAVISVGANNRYGHPHRETLALLQGKRVYRTDWHGDIIMRLGADKKLQIASTRRAPDQTSATEKPTKPLIPGAVIGNKKSKVYHTSDCPRLPKPENQARFRSAQEAEKAGYRPHACVEGE
jgi:competence protein ComEC